MPTSFSKAILPLFRPQDIACMKRKNVLLSDYNYMSDPSNDHEHAVNVLNHLNGTRKPQMPMGGPYWTEEQLKLYSDWMTDGFQP
jgi:hypothetical protein